MRTPKRLVCHLITLASVAVTFCLVSTYGEHTQAQAKTVYLTFDDGPSERYTPQILNILRTEHVPATFFVLGFRCEQFPHIVRTIHADGHEIGNHGFYHDHIVGKPDEWVQQDILKSDKVIRETCGVKPVYYRPPGGLIDEGEISGIAKLGHRIALWTVDSVDWRAKSAEEVETNVQDNVRPGSIILMHDGVSGSRYTVAALPHIIHRLRSNGYQFAVLPKRTQAHVYKSFSTIR